MEQPYLSIIVTGRNDNYGGDFNRRLQNSVQWTAYWANYYKLAMELVFVNYNPVAGNPPMEQMISWPADTEFFKLRIIDVPAEVHEELKKEGKRKPISLFEFVAKNVGIRRAKGQFVLCTNADVIFDPQIFAFIAGKTLKKGLFYRAARVDFNLPGQLEFTGDAVGFLEQIRKHTFKFFLKGGTFTYTADKPIEEKIKWLSRWNSVRRVIYTMIYPIRKVIHLFIKPFGVELFTFEYFCNASGDLFLMDKESWQKVKGYPEDTWISTHADSLHLLMTVVNDIKPEIMPWLIYHQEHERRFDFGKVDPDIDLMFERLLKEGNAMLKEKKSTNNNDANWGLLNYELKEKSI